MCTMLAAEEEEEQREAQGIQMEFGMPIEMLMTIIPAEFREALRHI